MKNIITGDINIDILDEIEWNEMNENEWKGLNVH